MSSNGRSRPRPRMEINPYTSSPLDVQAFSERIKQRTVLRDQGQLPRLRVETPPMLDMNSTLRDYSYRLTLEPPPIPPKIPPHLPSKDAQYVPGSPKSPAGLRDRQDMFRSQGEEPRLTSTTVRWPFFSKDEPDSAGSVSSVRRRNAVRRRNTTKATDQQGEPSLPRYLEGSQMSRTRVPWAHDDAPASQRGKTGTAPRDRTLLDDVLGVPGPPTASGYGKSPNPVPVCLDTDKGYVEEFARGPLGMLGRHRAASNRASWRPGDDMGPSIMTAPLAMNPSLIPPRVDTPPIHAASVVSSHSRPRRDPNRMPLPGPPPPRPRTARGYLRRPIDEPAPQNVVEDLRNEWQGIQRPVKVHHLPLERVSHRGQSKSQNKR
ncbi:hypothetical protein F5Y13DRAFT_199690 [Hypoxylon sp. FL1857]|nr:hypothetical protein F5Y13DRAFT_199690 [Hypoxylon sp. FL1857]